MFGLPRVRGDRPVIASSAFITAMPSPRARGSTRNTAPHGGIGRAFPAYAGIDPLSADTRYAGWGLPRVRGDRPEFLTTVLTGDPPSPRARGSTRDDGVSDRRTHAFPACAGIDLAEVARCAEVLRLPRVRGDRPLSAGPAITGACYKAANRRYLGDTQGRGKLHRFHRHAEPARH